MKRKVIFLFFLIFLFNIILSLNVFAVDIKYTNEDGKTIRLTDFLDTQGHWAHDQILKWTDYNIIKGYNGKFMPNDSIIRGDLAIIIDRLTDLKNQTYNYFIDLNNDDYFAKSMLKCVANGYINGVGNKQLNPRGNATREEVAVIFCRVFNIDTTYSGNTGFKDDSNISSWARSSVYALSKAGYLNGTPEGYVLPKNNITRAELITLLDNFADTYIPKNKESNEVSSGANSFISDFPKNIVVNKNITLLNSSVGRDIYITRMAGGMNLRNSSVMGRVVCLSSINLNLTDSIVSQVVLCNEKSTVSGISDKVYEVYIKEGATESTLNNYPQRIVLDPGVRVKIGSMMYENTTNRIKIYTSSQLKEDISEEQGYVVGGPKISKGTAKLDYNNNLIIEDITITNGEADVREVGIVWIENEEDEELLIPTYKRNDGKRRYYDSTYGAFDFEVGEIDDYCTYRLYVKDKDGLYAYSTAFTLKAYDYNIDMTISEEDYPKKLRVDVIFEGKNIPKVSNISVLYSENDLYNESLKSVNLSKYREKYSKEDVDDTKYMRFTGVLNVSSHKEDGEIIYEVPTSFGYYINFGVSSDNNFIREFPVLSNVIPDGADLIDILKSGSVSLSDNRITINDSKVRANLIGVDEVGIAYKFSSSNNMSSPEVNSNGWNYIEGGYNIDIKETYTFDTNIYVSEMSGNTFYVPYAKTQNGYFYGDVKKLENNWMGDKNCNSIISVESTVLDENNVVIELLVSRSDILANDRIEIEDIGTYFISDVNVKKDNRNIYILLTNKNFESSSKQIRFIRESGEKSNISYLLVDMQNKSLFLSNKVEKESKIVYSITSNEYSSNSIELISASIIDSLTEVSILSDNRISLPKSENIENKKVIVSLYVYEVIGNNMSSNKKFKVDLIFDLY